MSWRASWAHGPQPSSGQCGDAGGSVRDSSSRVAQARADLGKERLQSLLLWRRWQRGLRRPLGLGEKLPALRLLLVLDDLAGHFSYGLVGWLFEHGIMPLYTPVGGSWLNMAESVQRILKRRALECQHPQSPAEIIDLLESTAEGWNREPTPFEWGGRRAERRRLPRRRAPLATQWRHPGHLTH